MNVGELVGILRIDDQMAEGVRRALNDAERRFDAGGDAAGDRFVRGVDGKIRDTLTGRFAAAGNDAGSAFGVEASDSMGAEMEGGGGGKIAGALGGLAAAGLAAATAAGAVLGAGLLVGVAGALERQQGEGLLQAQLNLTEEQAAAAGQAAANVYGNNFGDSLGGVQEAVGAVWSTLGDSIGPADDALERATERALTLAQIMGVDVADAAQGAGMMIRSGLAGEATEAMDLLTAATQALPAAMRGELLPQLEAYGPAFKNLGLTGAEAMDLITTAAAGGPEQLDKAGDALKELTALGTDMSANTVAAYEAAGLSAEEMAAKLAAGGPAAREGLEQIVDGLLAIEDPVERLNSARSLFGTPLEDIAVSEVTPFLETLNDLGDGMEDVAGRTDKAATDISDDAGSKFEAFKRKGEIAFKAFVGGKILGPLESFADKVAPLWDSVLAAFKTDGISGAAERVGGIWDMAWSALQTTGKRMFVKARAWFAAEVPGILAGIGDLAEGLWDWLQDAYPAFARKMADLYGQIANWFAETGIPAIGEWLKEAGPKLWQWLQDAYPEAVKKMGGLFAMLGGWWATVAVPWMLQKGAELGAALLEWWVTEAQPAMLRGLASFIAAAVVWIDGTAVPWLRQKGSELWSMLVATAREQGPVLLAWLATLPGAIGGWITGTAIPALRSKAAEWFASLAIAAKEKAGELMGTLAGIPGAAVRALGDLGSALLSAGRALIQGLIDGIRSKLDELRSMLGGVTNSLTDWKGPPSRDRVLLRPAGRLVMGGFMAGIDDQVVPLRRQLESITAGIDGDLTGRIGLGGRARAAGGPVLSDSQIDYDRLGRALARHLDGRPITLEQKWDGEVVARSTYRPLARMAAIDARADS